MRKSYFKIRGILDFSPHRFEIGNPVIQNKHYLYNHFFKKMYSLNPGEYTDFYQYHLSYFLKFYPDQHQDFLEHFYRKTSERLAFYKMQDLFSSKQKNYQFNIERLEAFQSFLHTIDQWHVHQPLDAVIAEKSRMIDQLTLENEQLREQIKAMREYEPSEKIVIAQSHLPTFVDLLQQMQGLTLSKNKRLLIAQNKSGWYKMLSRYFQHGENPIPIETARNYFSGKRQSENVRGTSVKENDKLFNINYINSKK
ncbi:MAG TPA: hypothetical protein VGN64_02565 [Dyadobacter sp.]|nr:hypothetical protein [Dyadobacter sp.]